MRYFLLIVALACSSSLLAQPTVLNALEVQQEVEELKEQVLKEKLRVRQLEEAILLGKLQATYALVTFRNDAEGDFKFLEGEFFLNGKSIAKIKHEDLEKNPPAALVLEGEIPQGENTLNIKLRYQGQKKGPFTYVEDYIFNVDSTKVFEAKQGQTRILEIIASDSGLLKKEYRERLQISYQLTNGT